MHRSKMRPLLLIAGLVGLVAIAFGLVHTTNNAQASMSDGVWKLVGTSPALGQKSPAVWNLNVPAAKVGLVKGALVVTKSNPANLVTDHPVLWRVIAYKDPKLTLERVPGVNCPPPAPPAGVPPTAGQVNVYTGPCSKGIVAPGNATDLSGVSDLVVDGGNPAADLYHCMIRVDIIVGDTAKVAAECFDNTGALGAGASAEPLNSLPGEGPSGDAGGVGPPPPPPYSGAPPAKGAGTYTGDTLAFTTCFPDVGKSVNIIATTSVPNAHAQLVANGKLVGTTILYLNESNAACDTLTPVGAGLAPLGITIYPAANLAACPAGTCQHVAWRTGGDTDYDNDGCSDADELWQDKPNAASKCPDSPWNPFDAGTASTDVSGSYDLTAVAARQDCNPALTGSPTVCDAGGPGGGDHIPGFYYDCVADLNQMGKAVSARLLCYIDAVGFTVNPQTVPAPNANAKTCPPAPAEYCGDGVSGAPPPGNTVGTYPTNKRLFADVDDKHTVLTGEVDNTQNVIKLRGCFEDRDGLGNLGNVYADAIINLHTGHGAVKLWVAVLPLANCTQVGGPGGSPSSVIAVHTVRQAAKAAPPLGRDTDSDGCPNKAELGDNAVTGGLRDPSNHYDYMEASQNGQVRINDIIAVVNEYFIDDLPGPIDMKSLTDRTSLVGGNPWNLGPPNGQQRVDDILAQVKQYFHDC